MAKKKSTAAGKDTAPAVPEEPDLPNPPAFAWQKVPSENPLGEATWPGKDLEPAWAAEVRANVPATAPTGPPPLEVPRGLADRINYEKPFIELTLIHTGRYTGPTKGRFMEEAHAGFMILTERDGVFFVPWSNVAYYRFLPET